ncbi:MULTISPECIES: hypothetical protein [unclassified Luteococcus]|uniref:hypothetical protein n=1 Tax=unclassified Luteococcus TaxID=2639923 RepID=UPI00313D80B5
MFNDNTPITEFGWTRAAKYTLFTMAIWAVCTVVAKIAVASFDLSWMEVGFPGAGLAIVCGVVWEYIRRDGARKAASRH